MGNDKVFEPHRLVFLLYIVGSYRYSYVVNASTTLNTAIIKQRHRYTRVHWMCFNINSRSRFSSARSVK